MASGTTADRVLRVALWTTAFLNVSVALAAAAPDSFLGRSAGLPADAPLLYRLLLAWTIAVFGLGYAWLATQASILRPLVVGAIVGKGGVFLLVAMVWAVGEAPGRLLLLASGDLAYSLLFFWWLRASAPGRSAA